MQQSPGQLVYRLCSLWARRSSWLENTAVLCVGSAVFERRAEVCKKDSASAYNQVCGVVVRLYKYLVNDYYSEFLSAFLAVLARLECVSVAPATAGANFAKWQHLESLYEQGVCF